MTALAQIRRLFEHLAWADRRVTEALGSSPEPSSRALGIFAHVIGAELVWLARIEGRESGAAVWPELTLAQCVDLARDVRERYGTLLASLREADLSREVAYTNSAGLAFRNALADVLLHVALHGSYHRGQVAWIVRQSGGTPAPTDYVGWVRGVPAATRIDVERRDPS